MGKSQQANDTGGKVAELEQRLYRSLVVGAPSQKTARLLVTALGTEEFPEESVVNEALKLLISREDIMVLGLVQNWRSSEISRI